MYELYTVYFGKNVGRGYLLLCVGSLFWVFSGTVLSKIFLRHLYGTVGEN